MITYLKGLEIWPKLFLLVGTEIRGTCGLTYMFINFLLPFTMHIQKTMDLYEHKCHQ